MASNASVPDSGPSKGVVQSVMSAVRVQDSELKRWRRTFDTNAKAAVNGEKCVLSTPPARFFNGHIDSSMSSSSLTPSHRRVTSRGSAANSSRCSSALQTRTNAVSSPGMIGLSSRPSLNGPTRITTWHSSSLTCASAAVACRTQTSTDTWQRRFGSHYIR
jgi:hypothetical protein